MNPENQFAAYDRAIARTGETVTLRRTVANASPIDVQVRARVTGYALDELVGGIGQGDRKVIIPAKDVEASGFPLPFRKGSDAVMVRGTRLTIQSVDDSTRRIAGRLIAYDVRATGA